MASTNRAGAMIATVVAESVERLEGEKGPYTLMRNAVISREGHDDFVRTVMVFGNPNQRISHLIEAGIPIELAMRFNGGTMRVVGLPRREGVAAELLVAHVPGTPYAETVIKTLYGVLAAHGIDDRDLAGSIITQMMTGESESPCDDEMPYDPDVIERAGHLLLPLVDAGVDHEEALSIAGLIDQLPISAYLGELALLRRQTVAREFICQAA